MKIQIMSKLAMQGVQNENTCGYLASTIMPATLQTSVISVMIFTHESKLTSSTTLMNNSPIHYASLYFSRVSIAFKNIGAFWEDTMKLMSGWHVASIRPLETILTPDEGYVHPCISQEHPPLSRTPVHLGNTP